jgi:hypothetical protein
MTEGKDGQIKALMKLGASLEDALRYVGVEADEAYRKELVEYGFKLKVDEAEELEKKLRELIDTQIEKGNEKALIWALEHKVGRYSGGVAASGVINITIAKSGGGGIVEEG